MQIKHNMIDNFLKYKFFYVNGSSFTQGGGLEEPKIRPESSRYEYEKHHDVTWSDRSEVNWAARLSEIINIPVINESRCGGGIDRSTRMTYDFIYKHWEDRDKFFIILENPDSSRCDVFYTKLDKYFIVNVDTKKNPSKLGYATRDYYNPDINDVEHQSIFSDWVDRHFKLEEKVLSDEKNFIGLYSFCKLNNIKVYVMRNNYFIFENIIDKNDIISFDESSKCDSINIWCRNKNLLIRDEIGPYGKNIMDNHPGYFGHIEYAKKLSEFLGWKEDFPEYPTYKNYKKKLL